MKASTVVSSILAVFPFFVSSVPIVENRVEIRDVDQPNGQTSRLYPTSATVVEQDNPGLVQSLLPSLKQGALSVHGARVYQSAGSHQVITYFSWDFGKVKGVGGKKCSIRIDLPEISEGTKKIDVHTVASSVITGYNNRPPRGKHWGTFTVNPTSTTVGTWNPENPQFDCPTDSTTLSFEVSAYADNGSTNITWSSGKSGMVLYV